MEPNQVPVNCVCCEVILPEYEDTIVRQTKRIKELTEIIERLKNEREEAEEKV